MYICNLSGSRTIRVCGSDETRHSSARRHIQRSGIALRVHARRLLNAALACLLALPAVVLGQTLLEAAYDPTDDSLVVEVAYQGTHPNHRFQLEWEPCVTTPDGRSTAVARLIDQNGDDVARDDFKVQRRFSLSGFDCRPADVTIRLGPVSNRTVAVPARGR